MPTGEKQTSYGVLGNIRYELSRPESRSTVVHSAEGSTWKNHKYIKRVNGTYYYPQSSGSKGNEKKDKSTDSQGNTALGNRDVDALAKEVIRGNFGNGQTRKDLLGKNYRKVQDKVNQILKGDKSSFKVSSAKAKKIKTAGKKHVEKTLKRLSKGFFEKEASEKLKAKQKMTKGK